MFSPRRNSIWQFKRQQFDLLVIGGGITGAGIALDAASRGLSVALVEKGDFASGTSSKSTKLIHGGLRYLKQFELQVVHEVGVERAIVHGLAPHLVRPEKMLLPFYNGGTLGRQGTAVGLWLYDFLAGVKNEDRRRMLSRQQTMDQEPWLRSEGLLGGGLYAEYRTDDARLTIEVVKSAIRYGATCLNYVEVLDFITENNLLLGAMCRDADTGLDFDISATTIVNAAGPWLDLLREKDRSLDNNRLFLSKGSHIVVARERLPLCHSVYFELSDSRMVFAIPRQRATYIGTTDTPFEGSQDEVFASRADVEYLLDAANVQFPNASLSFQDVESTWAGLRPLVYEAGKTAGAMSRKDEIFISKSGLISVAGGKLTGYRKMAEKLVNLVLKRQGQTPIVCLTKHIALTEEPFASMSEVFEFQHFIEGKLSSMADAATTAVYLTENYGRVAEQIVESASPAGQVTDESLLLAELRHCLEHELVQTPLDFLVRRTGLLFFHMDRARRHLPAVLAEFRSHFNWTEEELEAKKHALEIFVQKGIPMSE